MDIKLQKEVYEHQGFLVIKDFFSPALCALLMERARTLIEAFTPDTQVIFSTTDQRHAKHRYFLESGDKIHFFFEENAFDAQGRLCAEKYLCINKIGHALHDLDPLFNCFSRQHKIAALVHELGLLNPLLIQSMYLCKQPYLGAEVTCHQDSTYLYVKEQPVLGLWFALEDATIENGCLWALPGGHQHALKARMRVNENQEVHTEIYDDSPWPLNKMIPLEVPRGSLVVLHGLLPHMSKENTSPRSRHAYSLHLISNNYLYPKDNWLQRTKTLPFSGF